MATYLVNDLESATKYLENVDGEIDITNIEGSTRYYGTMVIDFIFKTLQAQYPTKINKIIFDVSDDHIALIMAIKLGYKDIVYNGSSRSALALLIHHKNSIK